MRRCRRVAPARATLEPGVARGFFSNYANARRTRAECEDSPSRRAGRDDVRRASSLREKKRLRNPSPGDPKARGVMRRGGRQLDAAFAAGERRHGVFGDRFFSLRRVFFRTLVAAQRACFWWVGCLSVAFRSAKERPFAERTATSPRRLCGWHKGDRSSLCRMQARLRGRHNVTLPFEVSRSKLALFSRSVPRLSKGRPRQHVRHGGGWSEPSFTLALEGAEPQGSDPFATSPFTKRFFAPSDPRGGPRTLNSAAMKTSSCRIWDSKSR